MTSEQKTNGQKYTPGPWAADGFTVYWGEDGHGGTPPPAVATCHSTYLADCANDPEVEERSGVDEQTAYANARLIAAAPELLAVAQLLARRMYDQPTGRTAIQMAVAAIAKATGEGATE